MSRDLVLRPSCSGCGSLSDLYGSNCKHMTLCFPCSKSMAQKKAKCSDCGSTLTSLIQIVVSSTRGFHSTLTTGPGNPSNLILLQDILNCLVKMMKQCLEDYRVPPDIGFSLLRYVEAFSSPGIFKQVFFAVDQFIRILKSKEPVSGTIRKHALVALEAQLTAQVGYNISYAGGKNLMVLLNVIQRIILSLKTSNHPTSLAFVDALRLQIEVHRVIGLAGHSDSSMVISESSEDEFYSLRCSCVIGFDLPKTVRSYVGQSRGRARKNDSQYIIMLERDNKKQRDHLFDIIRSEHSMTDTSGNRDPDAWNLRACNFEDANRYYVEATGASVTRDSSASLIYRYCEKLPGDRYEIVLKYLGQPLLQLKQSDNPHNLFVDKGVSSQDGLVQEKQKAQVHMPPEILVSIDVRVDILRSFYLLPSLVYRLESLMLANQIREEINDQHNNFYISSSLASIYAPPKKLKTAIYYNTSPHGTAIYWMRTVTGMVVGVDSRSVSKFRANDPNNKREYNLLVSETESKFVTIMDGVFATLSGDRNRMHDMLQFIKKEWNRVPAHILHTTHDFVLVRDIAQAYFTHHPIRDHNFHHRSVIYICGWDPVENRHIISAVGDEFKVANVVDSACFGTGSGHEVGISDLEKRVLQNNNMNTEQAVQYIKDALFESAFADINSGGGLYVHSLTGRKHELKYGGHIMEELEKNTNLARKFLDETSMFVIFEMRHIDIVTPDDLTEHLKRFDSNAIFASWLGYVGLHLGSSCLLIRVLFSQRESAVNWFESCDEWEGSLRRFQFSISDGRCCQCYLGFASSSLLAEARRMSSFEQLAQRMEIAQARRMSSSDNLARRMENEV